MIANQEIQISLKDEQGEAVELAGVVLTIQFFVRGSYRFGFRTKPTNNRGRVVATYEELEKDRLRHLEVQPLDYKTTLEECDDRVRIVLPSLNELRRAADVVDVMGQGRFPGLSVSWRGASNSLLTAEDCEVKLTQNVNVCALLCHSQGSR